MEAIVSVASAWGRIHKKSRSIKDDYNCVSILTKQRFKCFWFPLSDPHSLEGNRFSKCYTLSIAAVLITKEVFMVIHFWSNYQRYTLPLNWKINYTELNKYPFLFSHDKFNSGCLTFLLVYEWGIKMSLTYSPNILYLGLV